MSSKAAWAAAAGVLGHGLLEFGRNRETLRFEREREENLRRMQEAQLREQQRHSQAVEGYNADMLAANVAEHQAAAQHRTQELDIAKTNASAQAAHYAAVREIDKAKADQMAMADGFVWDGSKKTYVFDEKLFAASVDREKKVAEARYSYYGGSNSSEGRETDRRLNNLRQLRDEGDPKYKGKTDAQLERMAISEASASSSRQISDPNYETLVSLRAIRGQLEDRLRTAFRPDDRALIQQKLDEVNRQEQQIINSGGLLMQPPIGGGAATSEGARWREKLYGNSGTP